jgi:hypothetical protein
LSFWATLFARFGRFPALGGISATCVSTRAVGVSGPKFSSIQQNLRGCVTHGPRFLVRLCLTHDHHHSDSHAVLPSTLLPPPPDLATVTSAGPGSRAPLPFVSSFPVTTLLTDERVFLFAALTHLATSLMILVAAALVIKLAVDGFGSASLRRFGTRCGRAAPLPSPSLVRCRLSRIAGFFLSSLFW